MPKLTIEMKYLTDVGRKRRHNEDFVDFYEPVDPENLILNGRLYIVADGVGGGAAGEVASEYAVKKVLYEYYRSTGQDLGERLRSVIYIANADIFEHVEQRPELGRMGTTVVAVVIRGDELVVANVGDSRAYMVRNGEIYQITRDHSLVAKLVEEGSITPEEAERHPKRNVLLRSIGADPDVYPDIFEGNLKPGDQIVLCSDGLTRYVSDDEILGVATRMPTDCAVRQLVDMANKRGGKDNISVMLLRAAEVPDPSALAGKVVGTPTPVQPEFDTIHDTAHQRQKVSSRPRRRKWAWLTFGGIVGVLALLGILFIGGWALGPSPMSPMGTLTPTVLPANEITESTLSLTPTSSPAHQPIPAPTSVLSKLQAEFPTLTTSYKIPPVGQGLEWIASTWGGQIECISATNGIKDPNMPSAGRS